LRGPRKKSEAKEKPRSLSSVYVLLILSLAGSLALLFAGYRRLFVMLSLANLLNDTVTGGLALKASECAVERLILLNFNLTHLLSLPSGIMPKDLISLNIC
jgi:hypothetical protein